MDVVRGPMVPVLGWMSLAVAMLLCSSVAYADAPLRVTLSGVPGGGEDRVIAELEEIEEIEVFESSWFYQQVRSRAFQPQGLGERAADVMWVMRGSDIDIVVYFTAISHEELQVRFLTPAEGLPEHEFFVDLSEEGPTRGAVRLIRAEMERFIGAGQPEVIIQAPVDEADIPVDPAVARERALAAEQARAERLQRDWLWARAHFRMFRKDFGVAGEGGDVSFTSDFFPGFELDVEAFPFVLTNPDMVEPGVYATYNHGFEQLRFISADEDPPVETALTANVVTLEGGLIYRLDSPLDEEHRNRQLRIKLGARYETYSTGRTAEEEARDPVRASTALVSMVLGTRLVLPVPIIGEEFGITAAVDIIPFAGFVGNAALFGGGSRSFGFGSELGFVYEVMDNLFLSAGYTYRMMRSIFTGVGSANIENASIFDLNQGVRAGVVYQY